MIIRALVILTTRVLIALVSLITLITLITSLVVLTAAALLIVVFGTPVVVLGIVVDQHAIRQSQSVVEQGAINDVIAVDVPIIVAAPRWLAVVVTQETVRRFMQQNELKVSCRGRLTAVWIYQQTTAIGGEGRDGRGPGDVFEITNTADREQPR